MDNAGFSLIKEKIIELYAIAEGLSGRPRAKSQKTDKRSVSLDRLKSLMDAVPAGDRLMRVH